MKIKDRLISVILTLLFLFSVAANAADESSKEEVFEVQIAKFNEYTNLIDQIKQEKKGKIGYEAKALEKQLQVTEWAYHKLLWQTTEDLVDPDHKSELGKYSEALSTRLLAESEAINAAIKSNDEATLKLENDISMAKKSVFTTNEAVAKSRLSDMNWRLYLLRIVQEELYTSLVRNSQSMQLLKLDASADQRKAKALVSKQADMLSGLIGLNEDKLIKLEKTLSVVRNESVTGKKLISDIAMKNLEIQDYAGRLQSMVGLLGDMEVDSSLYKKTVLQAQNTLNADVFDQQVMSHLFTEWWLNTKKWFRLC